MKRVSLVDKVSAASDISKALVQFGCSANVYGIAIYTAMWRERAEQCMSAMVQVCAFLRSRSDPHLTTELIHDMFMQLAVLESFAWDKAEVWKIHNRPDGYFAGSYGDSWTTAVEPLKQFIQSLPAYVDDRRGQQQLRATDEYMFVVRQMAGMCCGFKMGSRGPYVSAEPLPEAEQVNRILILDKTAAGEEHDVTGYRREALGR
ncbi:hypothetical protein [Paracidovorax wautersii]|uniref:Uncharacterized protein n=1 Tax=Paracidovorax wautersii TaxID=1177982 RepID=A0A1I2HVY3_9BURK|nr:hypothetical protein [Paracidovorax wautersii]SFF34002.1 hypothetical protein SAMN04489711_1395 [Paracidovorax wautersii]